MTIEELQQNYTSIDWLDLIRAMFPDTVHVDASEKVMMQAPPFFEKFEQLLTSEGNRTLVNYLIWRLTQVSIPFLHDEAREYELQFQQETLGNQKLEPRWRECAELVNNL